LVPGWRAGAGKCSTRSLRSRPKDLDGQVSELAGQPHRVIPGIEDHQDGRIPLPPVPGPGQPGDHRAWIELAGEVVRHELAAGQSLRAHPGHVGMFTASVSFQVMRVPGVTNRYFGGDAHHFAVLSSARASEACWSARN
jgi:hypothetical protein